MGLGLGLSVGLGLMSVGLGLLGLLGLLRCVMAVPGPLSLGPVSGLGRGPPGLFGRLGHVGLHVASTVLAAQGLTLEHDLMADRRAATLTAIGDLSLTLEPIEAQVSAGRSVDHQGQLEGGDLFAQQHRGLLRANAEVGGELVDGERVVGADEADHEQLPAVVAPELAGGVEEQGARDPEQGAHDPKAHGRAAVAVSCREGQAHQGHGPE